MSRAQVGANSHSKIAADPDPGPECTRLGWRSALIEPVPQAFARLQQTYPRATARGKSFDCEPWCENPCPDLNGRPELECAACTAPMRCRPGEAGFDGGSSKASGAALVKPWSGGRIKLINAAVCSRPPDAEGRHTGCDGERRTMWYVDVSNATGNWGRNRSDARCLAGSGLFGWVQEIASLERQHVVRHSQLLLESRASERRCAACAMALGRPLPRDCVAEMISANLRSAQVREKLPRPSMLHLPASRRHDRITPRTCPHSPLYLSAFDYFTTHECVHGARCRCHASASRGPPSA